MAYIHMSFKCAKCSNFLYIFAKNQKRFMLVLCIICLTLFFIYKEVHIQKPTCNGVKNATKTKPNNNKKKRNDSPVTIEKYSGTSGYIIREADEKEKQKGTAIIAPQPAIVLDKDKLEELKHQTKIAQELLSDIFTEEEEVHLPDSKTSNAVVEALEKLLEKDTWQREEVQELLGANVMIGNMLEQINDYAYSKVDDIVVEEDGDTIYVTTEYKEQLI